MNGKTVLKKVLKKLLREKTGKKRTSILGRRHKDLTLLQLLNSKSRQLLNKKIFRVQVFLRFQRNSFTQSSNRFWTINNIIMHYVTSSFERLPLSWKCTRPLLSRRKSDSQIYQVDSSVQLTYCVAECDVIIQCPITVTTFYIASICGESEGELLWSCSYCAFI